MATRPPGASSTAGASERTARAAHASPPPPPRPVERPIEVDAKTLFDEYQQNEVAADDRYKGKKLLVRGTVQSVDKDFLDSIIVRLATSNQFMGAMARMEDGEKSQASRLRKGEKVAVLCEGGGIVIGTPSLRDCTFAR